MEVHQYTEQEKTARSGKDASPFKLALCAQCSQCKKSVPPYGVKMGDSADPLDGVHAPVGPEFDPRTGHGLHPTALVHVG